MNEWIARNFLFMPELASSNGLAIDELIVWVHWLMLVLFVGWIIYFFYVLHRFSDKRAQQANYEGSKSALPKYVEIFVVLVEAVLLVGIAVPLWAKSVQEFPKPEDSTVIQVMGQQYLWNVRYPGADNKFGQQDMKLIAMDNVFGVDTNDVAAKDDIQLINDIHVPVNKPVVIYLSSKDVIHSFKLLAMRETQDAIPGLRIPLTFTPTKIGRYQVECAQLCGAGHSGMAGGFVTVESPEDFARWMKSKSPAAPQSFE
jgi:cytochrome c oxidase subunit 2